MYMNMGHLDVAIEVLSMKRHLPPVNNIAEKRQNTWMHQYPDVLYVQRDSNQRPFK